MSKKNVKTVQVVKAAEQENAVEITEGFDLKQYASELVSALEVENKAAHEKARGQSLPYADIVEAIGMLFDAANTDRAAVSVLADKVPKLLALKYKAMGNATNLVPARVGGTIVMMPANQLRELREGQLAHMMDPKVKDNFYRRIYGLGYRKEFKRFELQNGDLVRKVNTEGEGSQE